MRLPRGARPPAMRRPRADAGDLAVLAVPGLGLSVDGWRAALTLLAPLDAAAVALPAFGLPASPREPLDPASSAVRLLEHLDALAVTRTVLAGHSASCQIVAEVARRAPERVTGLILVGPTTDPRAATWPRLARRWLATATAEPAGQVPLLARDYTYSGLVSFARAMDAARHHDLEDALAGTSCPVLVLRGAHDHLSPSAWTDRLAGRPGARSETLGVGAHMVPLTHPRELVSAMRPFLLEALAPPE